jgi:hypothetical protein
MPPLSLNPRKAKIHRSYNVAEVAALFGITRSAVRAWCGSGLPATRVQGGILIYGDDLRVFLETRRADRRAVCPPGSIYCMRCRRPRRPLPETIAVTSIEGRSGNVSAPCPHCNSTMNRRVSMPRLLEAGFSEDIVRRDESHLDDNPTPSVKAHFNGSDK